MTRALIQLKPNIADPSELELFSLELNAFGLHKLATVDARGALQMLEEDGWVNPPTLNLLAKEAEIAKGFPWGYLVQGEKEALHSLAKRSAFVFRVFNLGSEWGAKLQENLVIPGEYGILELVSTLAKKKANTRPPRLSYNRVLAFLRLELSNAEEKAQNEYLALIKHKPEGPLSHNLHYYKAKFFPRLARSLLNAVLPRNGGCVLDPFVGSGTTLLESSLLNNSAVGIDIDPLSVLISQAKIRFLNVRPQDMDELISTAERIASRSLKTKTPTVSLPRWLIKNRKMTPEAVGTLTEEIAFLRSFVGEAPSYLKDLAKVFASDAITNRVRMRFLGTGSGRFSLRFSKKTSVEILIESLKVHKHIAEALSWTKESGLLPEGTRPVQAKVGDARDLDYTEEADAVLTSPPYLPASSGRESYAKHRTLSLLAVGNHVAADIDLIVQKSVGTAELLKGDAFQQTYPIHDLSDTERFVLSWLQKDPLRQSKTPAFAQYFIDIRSALAATHRALKPGSRAVFVVGKQSTFYEFSSKKPLLVVPLSEIFATSAEKTGFAIEKVIDIRLAKRTPNARPRSLDDYFETVLILRK